MKRGNSLVASATIYFVLSLMALAGLLPIVHTLAISLSEKAAVTGGLVKLWPMGFHIENYREIITSRFFLNGYYVSTMRVVVGVAVQITLVVMTGYPIALESRFRGRNVLIFFLIIPMMFSGGLIPTFLVVNAVGLLDSFWVLIITSAVPIFSIIIFMNYVRGLPAALMESATIDGAGHVRIIVSIIMPLALPSVATLVLFSFVFHWNSWFDGLIYINDIAKWPIQTVLRSFLTGQLDMTKAFDISQLDRITKLSDTGFKAAEVILIMVPLLLIYPFLQRYYIKGLTLGAVKQ